MIIYSYYTRDEAIKFVKKSYRPGCTHFVAAGTMLYTVTPDKEGKGGRGYDLPINVKVSQADALQYIRNIFGEGRFIDENCKIKIGSSTTTSRTGGCIFIG